MTKAAASPTSTSPFALDTFKAEGQEALWRAGSKNFSKLVKKGLVTALQAGGAFGKTGGKGAAAKKAASMAQAFEELLDTEFGDIIISGIIGYGIQYVPHFGQDPRIQRLAKENRVGAMEGGLNQVMGLAVEHLFPVLQTALAGLPEVPAEQVKVRLTTDKQEQATEAQEEEHEAEETKTTKKTLKA